MQRIALALALAVAVATPAVAGPPWISVETRPFGGLLLVHTFHHGTPMALPLTGSAEGLLNGRRTTIALRFEQDGETNSYAVPNTWGGSGVWVLNIGVQDDYHSGAGAVVGIDRSGTVAFVRFPRNATGFSRTATQSEVGALLRALDQGGPMPSLTAAGAGLLVLRQVGPLVFIGLSLAGIARLIGARVRSRRSAVGASFVA